MLGIECGKICFAHVRSFKHRDTHIHTQNCFRKYLNQALCIHTKWPLKCSNIYIFFFLHT